MQVRVNCDRGGERDTWQGPRFDLPCPYGGGSCLGNTVEQSRAQKHRYKLRGKHRNTNRESICTGRTQFRVVCISTQSAQAKDAPFPKSNARYPVSVQRLPPVLN